MLVSSLRAQQSKLDDLAKQLGKEIAKAEIKSAVVTDFITLDGDVSQEGKILAARLLDYWRSHNEKFSIVERAKLDALLAEQKLTLKDLENSETLQKVGETLNVEALVLGTVTKNPHGCSLSVLVRRLQDSKLQSSASKSFSQSEFPPNVGREAPQEPNQPTYRAGLNGVGKPVCEYCPDPEYPDELRRQKIEGAVLLDVIVSVDGRVLDPIVIKAPNDDFARKAIEAVLSWKLKPATGPAGNPVNSRVQVEIRFRIRK